MSNKILVFIGILIAGAIAIGLFLNNQIASPNLSNPLILKTQADETVSWKTYKDNNYSFSFNYPSEWFQQPIKTNQVGYDLEIIDPRGEYKFIYSITENRNKETEKPFENIEDFIDMPYQTKVLKIYGQDARQYLPRAGSENINKVSFLSKDSKWIHTLSLQTGETANNTSEERISEGQKLFDKILNTFKLQ